MPRIYECCACKKKFDMDNRREFFKHLYQCDHDKSTKCKCGCPMGYHYANKKGMLECPFCDCVRK